MSKKIDGLLAAAVERGDVPNAVAVAADADGRIEDAAAGPRAVGGDDLAGPDTLFRLASMTKMITTAAALVLVDQGRLDLDAPVAEYRPEFDELMVLESVDGDVPKLRPAASRATVRQLASHTSGLGYWFWNADLVAWEAATGVPNVLAGDARAFTAPLVADPGTRVEYGHSTDWLGKIVETVSGRPLDVHLDEAILQPLAMNATTFHPSEQQRANLAAVHVPGEDGSWMATDIDWPREPDWWPGGHGLYSTPNDYLRFQRMLLRGGELDGVRVLSPQIVDAAFSNQVGDLLMPELIPTASPAHSADFPAGPGQQWGLGLMLNSRQDPGMRAPLSGSWAGLCNSYFWVDRATGITGAVYSQFLPFATPPVLRLYAEVEKALYAGR